VQVSASDVSTNSCETKITVTYKNNDVFCEIYEQGFRKYKILEIILMCLISIQPLGSASGYLLACSVVWAAWHIRSSGILDAGVTADVSHTYV
jgi:hypothetical protein